MKKLYTILILSCLSIFSMQAQLNTSYFVKGFTTNHELNAAFAPKVGYVGIPVLSNINIGAYSNLGASTLLYPQENGKVALFLNNNVPSEVFLNKLAENNFLDANVKLDIMNAGWYGGRSDFWSLS